jgi:hypothetical protein
VGVLRAVQQAQHLGGLGDVLFLFGGQVGEEGADLGGRGHLGEGLVFVDGLQFAREHPADARHVAQELVV